MAATIFFFLHYKRLMLREHLRSAGRHQCKRLAYSVPYGGHVFFLNFSQRTVAAKRDVLILVLHANSSETAAKRRQFSTS